jgi:hypothetical protein
VQSTIIRYLTLVALLCSTVWLALAPDWEPVVALIGLLASFVAIDRGFTSVPSISGRWEYRVVTADREFSHNGDCYVHQDGRTVRIQGVRRYTCALKARRKVCKAVEIPWASEWAQVCEDGVLRFDYHIAIAEPRRDGKSIEAICRLNLMGGKPDEMTGKYYMLPPFDEATLNCKWGSIVFKRLAAGDEVQPFDDDQSDPGDARD